MTRALLGGNSWEPPLCLLSTLCRTMLLVYGSKLTVAVDTEGEQCWPWACCSLALPPAALSPPKSQKLRLRRSQMPPPQPSEKGGPSLLLQGIDVLGMEGPVLMPFGGA